jgi:hypothetical protein
MTNTTTALRTFPEIGTLMRNGTAVYYTFLPNGNDNPVYVEHTDIEEVTAYLTGIQIR